MAEKKAFLLRIDPAVWAELERLAQAELRSVNAQIEFCRAMRWRDGGATEGAAPNHRDGGRFLKRRRVAIATASFFAQCARSAADIPRQ
jgi:hypothetical protein